MSHPAGMLESILAVGPDDVRAGTGPLLEQVARQVRWVYDTAQVPRLVSQQDFELVLLTQAICPEDAVGLAARLADLPCSVPLVAVLGQANVNLAVRLVRQGVYDVIPGPLDRQRLEQLAAGLRQERGRQSLARSRFFCADCPPSVPIVGRSEAMARVLELLRLISESSCNPILILGETGTGKELAARAVHAWRCGGQERFVDVNCAALTASLLESELFGHVRGSFTGADRDKTGLLELAGAGTVFLDEISEMPLELQAKLLRVLQERTFRKVGGTGDIRCEATIIASSNRPLLHDTRAGRFRMDLYYRLAVFPITLPPLRDPLRRDDIGLLAEYFIANSSITSSAATALSPEAMDRLMEHDWPGNVRELRNVIDRAMILERSAQIAPRNLHIEVVPASVTPEPAPAKVAQAGASAPPAGPASAPDPAWAASPAPSAPSAPHEFAPPPAFKPDSFSLETAEREFILRALQETGWQRTRAAALLGITRATLHAKLKRYDIRPPDGSPADEGQAVPANPSAAALD